MTTLLSSIVSHVSSKSAVAKCARWAVAAAIGGLAMGSSDQANAQVLLEIGKQPDLAVDVSASPLTSPYDDTLVSMTVRNLPPVNWVGRKVPIDNVQVTMDLAGLEPVFVAVPAGFNCYYGARFDTNFYYVVCDGSLSWGSSATFEVWAEPRLYCGTPAYSDASALYTGGQVDGNVDNNRAIARTDFEGCIN